MHQKHTQSWLKSQHTKTLPLILAALIASCDSDKSTTQQVETANPQKTSQQKVMQSQVDVNQAFDEYKEQFLEDLWALYPDYAMYVGYYKYDDQLVVPDAQFRVKQQAFLNQQMAKVKSFETQNLNATNRTDLALIKNQLESSQWSANTFKPFQWNPSQYNVARMFGFILNTDYKPLDERMAVISKRLDKVPAYYAAAKVNISKPTLAHTELAIQQSKGALGVFKNSIPENLAKSGLDEAAQQSFSPKLEAAIAAVEDYIGWLENKKAVLEDGGARDFRIGAELYEQKFKFDIVSNYTARELYEHAIKAKEDLHREMISITKQLWPKYFADQKMPVDPLVAVKQLIDHLSAKHVKRDEFVDEVKRQMPIIQQFIIDKDLLDVDQSRPLVVRETPAYQRGFSVASIESPGPYDATANTYYNVSPLDDYTDEQAESFLREYNHWILQILNIHEAMPGHYTQLVHANKSPSKIKAILGNGAMVEGWAVYTERMMLEQGYADNEPEMWLMYSKWNLRVVANTILDYSIQVLGMTKEDGLDLLMNQAFQEKTEAEGKWRRATLSQVQLTSYYNGYAEIYAFREELKKKQGDRFDLKAFHNKFLSYGNAPVPVIRDLMLQEYGL